MALHERLGGLGEKFLLLGESKVHVTSSSGAVPFDIGGYPGALLG
jgi:hypothetical protein